MFYYKTNQNTRKTNKNIENKSKNSIMCKNERREKNETME